MNPDELRALVLRIARVCPDGLALKALMDLVNLDFEQWVPGTPNDPVWVRATAMITKALSSRRLPAVMTALEMVEGLT